MDIARRAVEGVVREHRGRVLGGLVRYLGDFDLAEDALADAVTTALERWPVEGVPRTPPAWIVVTARRKALDRLRKRAVRKVRQEDLLLLERLERDTEEEPEEIEIPDERLALMFTCCHPALTTEAQVALTLRTLGGLSTPEIARCFLVPEVTLAQRIVRAKGKIASAKIPFRVPERTELPERLSAVLSVLYLVFNEGYSATTGALVRADLCEEGIRLVRILAELLPEEPEVLGLLALMLLHDSRRAARVDEHGALVTLEEQDRSRWDPVRTQEGCALVRQALSMRRVGPYQIQAAIAAVHAEAPNPAQTDWWQIVGLYTALSTLHPTPVVTLNRAAALAMAAGPEVGLAHIEETGISEPLADYYLLHAARADLYRRLGRAEEAASAYRRALDLVSNAVERAFLEQRLASLRAGGSSP
jgi:RNA polymerase sigma-70 factor (ECF subfamily)